MSANNNTHQVQQAFRDHPELLDGDGWTIFAPDYYTTRGIPAETLPIERIELSGDGKHAITRPDGSVGDVAGIHNLRFLRHIAENVLNIPWDRIGSYGGRGSQARAYCRAIEEAIT